MVDQLLDVMLGPFRGISQFYIEHQLIFNTIIVGIAIYQLYIKRKQGRNASVKG